MTWEKEEHKRVPTPPMLDSYHSPTLFVSAVSYSNERTVVPNRYQLLFQLFLSINLCLFLPT
jgi:hypothetical protein